MDARSGHPLLLYTCYNLLNAASEQKNHASLRLIPPP